MRRLAVASLVLALFTACFGDARELTGSGKGYPELFLSVPETVQAGSEVEVELTVNNPGPGDMDGVVVAFAAVGPSQGETDLPTPLVGFANEDGVNASVISVDPEPQAVGQGGVLFRFGPLAEGDSAIFTFVLRAPVVPGVTANSLQVYDSADTARARGVRLETLVER